MFYSIVPLEATLIVFKGEKMYLLPLEGVRGEESSLGEGLGGL